MKRQLSLLFLLISACLILPACGPGNSISLLPPPPIPASATPSPTAPSVSIVNFSDDRADLSAIGARRDGSAFTTTGDVSQWVSRALADELARKGLRVTFAMNTREAKKANPDFMVTGKVEEVWLKEVSAVELRASLRVWCSLANRKGRLWQETLSTQQSRGGLPSRTSANELLLGTLRDLLKPVAEKIAQSLEKK